MQIETHEIELYYKLVNTALETLRAARSKEKQIWLNSPPWHRLWFDDPDPKNPYCSNLPLYWLDEAILLEIWRTIKSHQEGIMPVDKLVLSEKEVDILRRWAT